MKMKKKGCENKFSQGFIGLFFENWDKSSQKKWDKGVIGNDLTFSLFSW